MPKTQTGTALREVRSGRSTNRETVIIASQDRERGMKARQWGGILLRYSISGGRERVHRGGEILEIAGVAYHDGKPVQTEKKKQRTVVKKKAKKKRTNGGASQEGSAPGFAAWIEDAQFER